MKINRVISMSILFSILFLGSCSTDIRNSINGNKNRYSRAKADSLYNAFEYKIGVGGGNLKLPLFIEPTSFSPYVEPASVPYMYEGLMKYDNGKLKPALAESWTVSSDSLTWKFKIRDLAFWSDSVAVTVDDIIFTFSKYLKKSAVKKLLNISESIKSIIVEGEKNVTIKVTEKNNFDYIFTLPILPTHAYGDFLKGSFDDSLSINTSLDRMVGSGPFIISEYAPLGRIVYVKNRFYYGRDSQNNSLPYIDTVTSLFVSDLDDATSRFVAKELDFLIADGSDLSSVKNDTTITLVRAGIALTGNVFMFNYSIDSSKNTILSHRFKQLEFRSAISELVDRSRIIDTLLDGAGLVDMPLYNFVNYDSLKILTPKYRPAKAISMLKKIGFSHKDSLGFYNDSLTGEEGFEILVVSGSFNSRVAKIVSDNLNKNGVKNFISEVSVKELNRRIDDGGWQSAMVGYDESSSFVGALSFWCEKLELAFSDSTKILVSKIMDNPFPTNKDVFQLQNRIIRDRSALFTIRSERVVAVNRRVKNINIAPVSGAVSNIFKLFITPQKSKK